MIYTFYSYKGGVGRSMALANLAEWFYQQGLRVVMVDWDLEAPGLETFFVSGEEIEKVRAKPGLIDMLTAYKEQYQYLPMSTLLAVAPLSTSPATAERAGSAEPLSGAGPSAPLEGSVKNETAAIPRKADTKTALQVLEESLPPLAYMLYPIHPPQRTENGHEQALWLLSAGWRSRDRFAEYGRAVQNFSWGDFYEFYHGEAYFEWLRQQLNSDRLADVVLIDSRTGLTEMGGVCTRQLADVVVSFTAGNVQNLNGVADMVASFKKKEVIEARKKLEGDGATRPLEVLVVPSRVDNDEITERNRFEKEFKAKFVEVPTAFKRLHRTFWDLLIPYIGKYAYTEKLTIGDPDRAEDLEKAYKNLAAHLVLVAPEGSALRARCAPELRRVFKTVLPRVFFFDERGEGDSYAAELRRRMEAEGLSLWQDFPTSGVKPDIMQRATSVIDLVEFVVAPVTADNLHSETLRKLWRYARQQGVCMLMIAGEPEGRPAEDDRPLWLRKLHIYDPIREWEPLVKLLKSPAPTTRVPLMMPAPPEGYVARPKEFDQMLEALLDPTGEGKEAARVALWGPGGCGKSALAKAFCNDERVITAFADGILWARLGENRSELSELTNLYQALTGERPSFADAESAAAALARNIEEKHCLLVIDDVCSEAPLLPFLHGGNRCARLFTTRDPKLATRHSNRQILVGQIDEEGALKLFTSQAKIDLGPLPDLSETVRLLDKVPLAIKLAGAELRKRIEVGSSPEKALEDLRQILASRGAVAFDQPNATERDQSVAKSIAASLNHFTDEECNRYLKLAAFPAEAEVSLAQVSALWGQDELAALDLIQRLSDLALLNYDSQKRAIRLTKLVRSFLAAQQTDPAQFNRKIEEAERIFARLTPEEQIAAQRALLRLVSVARPEDKLPDISRRIDIQRFDTAVRPVFELLDRAKLTRIETDAAIGRTMVQLDDEVLQKWPRLRAWIDKDRSFLLWRQSLEPRIAEWESSNRYNQTVLLRGNDLAAAKTWRDQRKDDLNESEKLYISEAARLEAEHQAQRRRRARLLWSSVAAVALTVLILLGTILYQRHKAERQVKNLIGAVESERKNLQSAADYVKKGETELQKSNGDPAAAVDYYTKAIDLQPDFASAYYGRGNAYARVPDYDRAVENYTRAINLKPDYAEAYNARGDAYYRKGADAQALKDYTEAIHLNPDDGSAYFNRALIYQNNGDDTRAFADFQKSYELSSDHALRDKVKNYLQQLAPKASSPPKALVGPVRIFVQYKDPRDVKLLDPIVKDLKDKGFRVLRTPELVEGATKGDVRYFNPEDKQTAKDIATIVEDSTRRQGIKIKILPLDVSKGYAYSSRGTIELWLPSLQEPQPAPPGALRR